MSLYSEIQFGAAAALPAGGTANVVGGVMSVRVEEDEMDLVLKFQGSVLGGAAGALTMGFAVDSGAGFAANPTLPLFSFTFLATEVYNAEFEVRLSLAKGEHKVALTANDAGSVGHTIDGAVVHSTFSATRVSSAATLAHGVDSKVQGIY
jgi:hypothetical protein